MTFSDDVKQKKQSISFSRWMYIFIAIFLVWFASYYFITKNKTESPIISDILTVKKWDLEIFVSGEWKIISWKKVELNFPVSWSITWIYKNEWDSVITWEKIAELDDDIYKLNLERANINLKNAYAKLAEKKEWVSDSELKVLEKTLDLAQESYNNVKLKLETDLANENNNYNSLVIKRNNLVKDINIEKSNYDLIVTDEDKKIENLENNLVYKWNILILDIDKYLNKIDELMWITPLNKDQNDDFEDYLWAKNSSLKTELINEFKVLNNAFIENKNLLVWNSDLLISYSSSLKKIFNKTILVISNSIESTAFTITDIQNYKSDFQSYLSALELDYQDLLFASNNLDYEITNKDILIKQKFNIIEWLIWDLEQANNDVENYSDKIENLKKINEKELLVASKELEKANLEYKNSIVWPSATELKSYYIDIEDALSRVKEAEKNLSDTLLKSPVDWTVLDINYRTWEYYWTMQKSFWVIISSDWKYIESYIEERDIANIEAWQIVDISVDAFESFSFTWVVNYVSTLWEEDKDEVMKYKVLINFENDNKKLRDSMSVSLEFLHEKLENIIIIPAEYIIYKDWSSNVMLADWTYRVVKEWLSDWENIEILSWLQIWDKIGLISE